MVHVRSLNWPAPRANRLLARAFVLSVLFHVLLGLGIAANQRFNLWRFGPLAYLERMFHAKPLPTLVSRVAARQRSVPKREKSREMPVMFVDVDPSQAAAMAPKHTKYYSAMNSLAGNPNTRRDTGHPEFNGTQNRVLKTMTTHRAQATPQPLRPTPPRSAKLAKAAQPKVAPVTAKANRVPPPQLTVQPLQPLKPRPIPGDLFRAKATPPSAMLADNTQPKSATPKPKPQHERPRRLSQVPQYAMNRTHPESALMGEKMQQDGGVRHHSLTSSLNVAASPFGDYDARFIAAVQSCWYELLDQHRYTLDKQGKVVLRFRLTSDGRIENMETVSSNVGEIYTYICWRAITEPEPYGKWPPAMRDAFQNNYRDVEFTFYY